MIPVVLVAVALPAGAPATASASGLVLKGKLTKHSKKNLTVTYRTSKGTITARWIGVRHYRITGKIKGRKLTGTIRTHQVKGDRYHGSGTGRLGSSPIKISGGGPNSLKTVTFVLRR
jgi:hypothetical protein